MKIANKEISLSNKPFIIAEIGNNHDKKLSQALDLIKAAGTTGVDAVKFQTYEADKLVQEKHPLYDFFKEFALPKEWHQDLKDATEVEGMVFLSSPFDIESAEFLAEMGMAAFKIASSDLTNLPLIRKCASFKRPLLLSTGMANVREAGTAIEAVRMQGCNHNAIMHCVSVYPTPSEQSQLDAICEFKRLFDVPIGFSDHSLSTILPAVSIGLGARIIEKHFTLDRNIDGPDHKVALEPDEFKAMVDACHEAFSSFNFKGKMITETLKNVRRQSLRGIYAGKSLKKGEIIKESDLVLLRPQGELPLTQLPLVIGKPLLHNLEKGEEVTKDATGIADAKETIDS